MQTTNPRLNLRLLTCGVAAWLAWLPGASAQTTNTIFNDTFDDGSGGLATRADDYGANYGLDIQWRPRVLSQAGSYSVVSDAVFGPALRFHNTANNLWIIGQFDADASDGVTFGSGSTPASLGGNVGDVLIFSMRIRTAATISGNYFRCGLTLVPGGPRSDDGTSDNSWVNLCTGYYITIPNGAAGQVSTCKQTGVTGVTPFGGTAQTILSTGIPLVNAGFGADTLGHTITIQLTRVTAGSVRVDGYWDGTLVATATDSSSPYTQFNSAMILYGVVTDYTLDDVKLLSTSISLGYQPPLAVNDAYGVAKNGVLTVAAPGVLGNDSAYNNAPMTATNLTLPAHGTLNSFNNDGGFVYTPNSNYFGTDSFTYQAYDAVTNSLTTTVTLNVVGYATWLGTASASWPNALNWSFSDLPAGQNVLYDNTSANLTQTLDQNWSIVGLIVSNVSGPVTIANGYTLTNSGPINLAGASADLTILADYAPSGANPAAIGVGRTVTVSNVLGSLNNAAGPGTLRVRGTMTGPVLDVTGSLTLLLDGASVTGAPPVRLTAETGGTVRAVMTNSSMVELTGNSSKINVGNNASTSGMNIFSLESGTLKVGATTGTGANVNNGIFVPNNNCFGVFNLNGGTVIMTNKQTASTNTTSETTLRIPANAAGNGVANLNGGQLVAPQIDGVALSTGSGVLNFNGTTIIANRSNATWIASIQNAYVLAGGAIFDTSAYEVTIPQNLSSPPVGTSGGLTKWGSGILHLTGNNTYSGPTIVAQGTLAVAGTYGTYPLGSALVASNGASINLEVPGGTTVFMPAITAAGAAFTLNYGTVYGNPGGVAINSPSYAGVTLNATGVNVFNILGSGFTAGDVPLIAYNGSIGGNGFSAFQLGSLPLGMSGTLSNDTANSIIVLHLDRAPSLLTWYGDKSADWDTSTANWNNGTALYTEVAGIGDIVTFNDALDGVAANSNVNLVGARKPVSVMVNSYGANYRFGGGTLSGPGSLSKDGTASLTLATANDFTGGSFLTNGVVYLGNDAGLGAGPVTFAGAGLASDGASGRTVTNAITFTPPLYSIATAIFGDGVNAGAVTLSGPVSWSGAACTVDVENSVVFSGVLANGGLDTKTGPGTLTFQNATDAMTLGNLQVEDGSMIVSSGTLDRAHGGIRVMALNSPSQRAYFGVLSGASVLLDGANINMRVGYDKGDASCTNVLDIAGTMSCTANGLAGAVQIGTNSALAQVNLRSGGLLRINSFTVQGPYTEVNLYGGTLAGTAGQARFMEGLGACYIRSGGVIINTEDLSGQPLSLTIAQALLDGGGGGLTKNGQGTLILTGANTYTGPTTVNAGVLQLSASQTAPGAVSVHDGATLAFSAPVAGFTVPVAAASLGSVTGACLSVTFSGSGNPTAPAASIGSLTLNGTVAVNVQVSPADTQPVPLVSYGSLHGTGTVMTGTLPSGLLGSVTNDTHAQMIELIITRVPPAAVVFNDTFEPDGATAATRNDDAGSGFGLDIQWRPRGNGQASSYSVTNDPVLGNAMQFNTGASQFLFTIGQFDNDAGDGVTLDTNSVPVELGGAVGESLKLSMDVRTTTILPSGYGFKAALMMAPNGPTTIDTTTGNGWTANWNGYAVSINNGVADVVTAFKEYPTYDTSDSLLKTGTNTITLVNASGATAAFGADTNKHTLVLQLTTAASSSVQFDAYWDNALVLSSLDTNSPPFTNFNSLAIGYGQVGTYVYDNVTLSKIKALPSPVAGADAYSLGMNTVLTIAAPGVLGNDTDPSGYPLTAIRVNPPAHGTLTLSGDGGFTYTPTADYSGADNFTYQANNGYLGSPIATVSLSVTNSAKVPPVLSASVSGSDLIVSGVGGTPGANAYVLTSTNLALSNWTLAATVALDGAGALSYTNAIDPAQPQRFFRVQMP